ncbi:MAG: glycosyltransferase family 39 protein [Gemmatimonadota bacterium]
MSDRRAGAGEQVLRAIAGCAGIALIIWTAVDPAFRSADHALAGPAALPVSAGMTLILAGLLPASLRVFAGWLIVTVVGQAAALQLIVAGTQVRYQHYLSISQFLEQRPFIPLILVALQAIIVAPAFVQKWPGIGDWLIRRLGGRRVLILGIALFLSGATVNRDIRAYVVELFVAFLVLLLSLITAAVTVAAIPGDQLRRWISRANALLGTPDPEAAPQPSGLDHFAWACAIGVMVAAALLNIFVYQRHPHILDEVVYLYQARYFAAGALSMAPPPVPAGFELYLMDVGRAGWYVVTPPGWSAGLALGVLLGVPWLVNPVLSGINVLLSYLLLRELYDMRTSRLALMLLSISPWYVYLGMSFMNHALTLTFALLAAVGVAWSRRTGSIGWGWIAGFALGAVSLIRQLDAMVMAGCLGLWAIGLGGRRLKLLATAGLIVGSMIVGAAILPYNQHFTGKGSVHPIMEYNDRKFGKNSNAYGFGKDRGMGWPTDPFPGHGPLDATVNANLNTTAISVELFGWSTGSLLLIYLFLLTGAFNRSDRLMLGLSAAVFAAYFLNYFSGGPDFGGRYWFLMIIPCVALTARAIDRFDWTPGRGVPLGGRLLAGAGVLTVGALLAFYPWRALDKYFHYRGMRPDILALAQQHQFGRGLVLIKGGDVPDFASAAIYNPLDLKADTTIYAWDRSGEVRSELLRAFASRPVWLVSGPSITKAGYLITAGPISADSAARLP